MRALVLLLLVVLAFLLVVKFYPRDAQANAQQASSGEELVETASPPVGEAGAAAAARFLSRPDSTPPSKGVPAASEPGPEDGVADAPEDLDEEAGVPDWLSGIEVPVAHDENEVAIGAALVHGGRRELASALQASPGFSAERAGLLEAFAVGLAGDSARAKDLAAGIDASALSEREKDLFQGVFRATPVRCRATGAESPVTLAMEMALAARTGEALLGMRRHAEAARAFSDLLLAELDAPWTADRGKLAEWTGKLDLAQAEHRWSPAGDWPSAELEVQPGDTLTAIRLRYLQNRPRQVLCTGLIAAANGLSPEDHIQPGQKLRIPTDPVRMLVDVEARWALYLLGDEVAASWPICVGRPGEETPAGEYVAREKLRNPPWMKIGQEPIPFGDPRNPLGTRWIAWFQDGVKTSYGFHGTADPTSIGQAASDGCVRLQNQDVERLYDILPEGSPIVVRD